MVKFDVVVVGGGIVGAATALALQKARPKAQILLIEKEDTVAQHQTGRNSGVIHAGVYYQPGSLKARYCRQGLARTIEFCRQYNLPYEQCGKLLVATDDIEQERMQALFLRCQENGLQPEMLTQGQLKQTEPNITGTGAFLVRQTGITDYKKITACVVQQFEDLGGRVQFNSRLFDVHHEDRSLTLRVAHRSGETQSIRCHFAINCAGLQTDNTASMFGLSLDFQIVPFKGEYYRLASKYNNVVKHLIYPIPDPAMPFLGVHLTRMIDGSVTVGPSAVLSLAREGYQKHAFSLADSTTMLAFKGLWKVLWQHRTAGLRELKNSFFRHSYLRDVNKYCPAIQANNLLPYPAGIRAQAVTRDGQLVHDFVFVEGPNSLHIGNAPSPAATSAFPIADAIVERAIPHLA